MEPKDLARTGLLNSIAIIYLLILTIVFVRYDTKVLM